MTEPNETKPSVPEPAAASTAALPDAAPASPGVADDRPELPVAASFAGGFLLALLLRRLAR
jgi:hypothetical protein